MSGKVLHQSALMRSRNEIALTASHLVSLVQFGETPREDVYRLLVAVARSAEAALTVIRRGGDSVCSFLADRGGMIAGHA